MKTFLAVTKNFKYYYKTRFNLNIEKQFFQLSLLDVNLVTQIIQGQLDMMGKEDK